MGWFKNKEREKYGKYSDYLYHDKPLGIITQVDSLIPSDITLDELFNKNELTILVKDSFSYGKLIDKYLKKTDLNIRKLNTKSENLFLVISKKRADFMFISYEETQERLKNPKYKKLVRFQR